MEQKILEPVAPVPIVAKKAKKIEIKKPLIIEDEEEIIQKEEEVKEEVVNNANNAKAKGKSKYQGC